MDTSTALDNAVINRDKACSFVLRPVLRLSNTECGSSDIKNAARIHRATDRVCLDPKTDIACVFDGAIVEKNRLSAIKENGGLLAIHCRLSRRHTHRRRLKFCVLEVDVVKLQETDPILPLFTCNLQQGLQSGVNELRSGDIFTLQPM